jgi:hypothetical protein
MHGYATSLDNFKNKVAEFQAFGKPIWVTEWAAHVSWHDPDALLTCRIGMAEHSPAKPRFPSS